MKPKYVEYHMENQNTTQTAQTKNAQSSYQNNIGILHVTRIAENQPTNQPNLYQIHKQK